MVKVTKGRH